MGLPFFSRSVKKNDQFVAIDLGSRSTKALYLQRQGNGFQLINYVIEPAPNSDKAPSPQMLAEHLKGVVEALSPKTRQTILAVGVQNSLLRHADMPMMPSSDMRTMLKFSSKNYLQEDLPGHVFDCHMLPVKLPANADNGSKNSANSKTKVLVGGMRKTSLDDLITAARDAGLILDAVVPGHIGPVNAFEMANPESFSSEVVALVDVGFKNSTISIVSGGELILNRVVSVGGDKLTTGLAETLSISYEEAESIKIGMPHEVQSTLETLLLPLGRELRTSADFFEHQHEQPVSKVLVSGGCACSEFLAQTLQNEVMAPCETWDPTAGLRKAISPEKLGELEQDSPRLVVAVGAAALEF